MQEQWKKIKYADRYSISTLGRCRSEINNIIKKQITNKQGYKRIQLYVGVNKTKVFRVHRLVAEAFIQNKHNKQFVNHKDLDKQNNTVDNLEWVTRQENADHAKLNGATIRRPDIELLAPKIKFAVKIGYKKRDIAKELRCSSWLIPKVASRCEVEDTLLGQYAYNWGKPRGIYFAAERKKYRVETDGIPQRQFTTLKQAIDYVVSSFACNPELARRCGEM